MTSLQCRASVHSSSVVVGNSDVKSPWRHDRHARYLGRLLCGRRTAGACQSRTRRAPPTREAPA